MKWKSIHWLDDLGILLIRLMLGSIFTMHGCQKLFGVLDGPGLGGFAQSLDAWQVPYPAYLAVVWGAAEFLGGVALLTGYAARWMATPLILTLAGAGYLMSTHAELIPAGSLIVPAGIEYPLTLTIVLLGLILTGPGKFALSQFSLSCWLPQPKARGPECDWSIPRTAAQRATAQRITAATSRAASDRTERTPRFGLVGPFAKYPAVEKLHASMSGCRLNRYDGLPSPSGPVNVDSSPGLEAGRAFRLPVCD